MNTLQKIIIGAITVGTITVGASAFADRDSSHHEKMLERVGSKLDLDDNQNAALSNFATELMETRELMRGPESDVRTQISELLTADTFDQGKALTMINERAQALQNKAPELVAAAAVFFDGLTAEQKSSIQDFAEKGRRGRHRH